MTDDDRKLRGRVQTRVGRDGLGLAKSRARARPKFSLVDYRGRTVRMIGYLVDLRAFAVELGVRVDDLPAESPPAPNGSVQPAPEEDAPDDGP